MVYYETGGKSYYDKYLQHPEWPGGFSGVTISIGYDCGYVSPRVFLEDWHMLPPQDRDRLFGVVGYKGQAAKSRLSQVRDIIIKWDLAESVFKEVDIPRYWQLTKSTFPGFENLHPDAQAVLVSIVFNRGSSMAGPGRIEMRQIARLSPQKDYKGMAEQIRLMKRLWVGKGQDGLLKRRESESKLMESCR